MSAVGTKKENKVDRLGEALADMRRLFVTQRFAVLGTYDGAMPYGSLVAFASTDDLSTVLFAAFRTSRKFVNLQRVGVASLLVDDRTNREADLTNATAVTAVGSVRSVGEADRDEWRRQFLHKHPGMHSFVDSPVFAWMQLQVERYCLVVRFQEVREIRAVEHGFRLCAHETS
jgi:hypothetical protein